MEPTNQEEKQSVARAEGPQGEKRLSQVIQIDEGKVPVHLEKRHAARWKRL